MDWISSLVGGAIGFIASMCVLIAEKVWDKLGSLKIFYRIISGGMQDVEKFGTARATDGSDVFIIPMVFELQNTTNTTCVIRDVSINLYYRGRYIAKMIQVGKFGNEENCKEYGGENQTYSFVVEAKSIRKVYGTFMYAPKRENSEEYEFDEIRLKYYDEKNRMREFHVRYVNEPWKQRNMDGDTDWIELKSNLYSPKPVLEKEVLHELLPMTNEKMTYLQMIQEPICRMSTISAIFKGFAATIVAGIAALTYCEINTWILGLSFMPVLLFTCLDIYYLKLEKKYRYLYEQVRIGKHEVDFSMKLTKDNKIARTRICDCIKSPSVWLFYPVMIAILAVVFILKMKGVI
ncbi:MAG: hypothetical protein IJ326_11105 [Lachnospiraceae bacterium]|nr:hypothetical protein [Lachnospiraceae bacterium]